MRIISATGICKEPSGTNLLDVGGKVNVDGITNLKDTLVLDADATIEASATSTTPNALFIGNEAITTAINIGVASHAKTITIGGVNDTVLIQGDVTYSNADDLMVKDKTITLNNDGLAASAGESGIEIEEAGVITSYMRVNAGRTAMEFKAPSLVGRIALQPSNDSILTLVSSATGGDKVWTFINTTDTVVGVTSGQTLTNKTLTSATLNGTTSIGGTNLNVSASNTSFTQPVSMTSTLGVTGTTTLAAVSLTGNITPNSNNTRDLGSSGNRMATLWTTSLNVSGTSTLSPITLNGNITLGANNTYSIGSSGVRLNTLWTTSLNVSGSTTFGSITLAGDILPDANNVRSMGNSGLRMANIWTTNLNASAFTAAGDIMPSVGGAWNIGSLGTRFGYIFVNQITATGTNSLGTSNFTQINMSGNITPSVNDAYFLGNSSFRWANVYTGDLNASGELTVAGSTASTFQGSIYVSQNNASGGGIRLADDGDIVDLNDGYCAMRFSSGVRIHSGNKTGGAVITLSSGGTITTSSLTVTSGCFSNLNPNFNNTYNLGNSINRWGTLYATATDIFSDSRLKIDIAPMSGMLDKIMQLKPKTWESKYSDYYVGTKGFLAQELAEVFPSMVVENSGTIHDIESPLSICTTGSMEFDAVIVQAIQDLKQQLDEAKAEIALLKNGGV